MYRAFRAAVKRHHFIQTDDSILAGVSGGVDSMVLADLLVRLQKDIPFKLAVAHVNYKMRGEESDAQEKLVRDFAQQHSLGYFVTAAKLRETGENFQQAARDFRYHYFAEVAGQIGASKVAVAHHRDDQAETILAQLLRGASLRGLAGMRSEREIQNYKLIRPLFGFSKQELKVYAREHNISFIEDSSNCSPKYWRNRIRHELLPLLEDLRPQSIGKLIRFGEEAGEVARFLSAMAGEWLQNYAKKNNDGYWLPRPRLALLPKALRMEIVAQTYAGLTGAVHHLQNDHLIHCDALTAGENGQGHYCLPRNIHFVRSGDDLLISSQPYASLKLNETIP